MVPRSESGNLNYYFKLIRTVILAVCIIYFVSGRVENEINHDFSRNAFGVLQGLTSRSELIANILYSYRGIYYSQEDISPEEWKIYHNSFLYGVIDKFDIEVNYIVYDANEGSYVVKYLHTDTNPPYVNLAERPAKVRALEKARDTGLITATEPHQLITKDELGMSLYVPLYEHGMPFATEVERKQNIVGYFSILIPSDILVDQVFDVDISSGTQLRITDLESGNIIYATADYNTSITSMSKITNIDFGTRIWQVEMTDLRFNYIKHTQLFLLITTVLGCAWWVYSVYNSKPKTV